MDDRLEAAEAALAHLTRAVEDLDAVVTAQADRLDRLERRMALLMEREAGREADEGGTAPLADWKPPHW